MVLPAARKNKKTHTNWHGQNNKNRVRVVGGGEGVSLSCPKLFLRILHRIALAVDQRAVISTSPDSRLSRVVLLQLLRNMRFRRLQVLLRELFNSGS